MDDPQGHTRNEASHKNCFHLNSGTYGIFLRDFYEEVHALPEDVDPIPVRRPRSSGPLNSLEMFLPVPDFGSDLRRTFTLHHPDNPADFVSRPIEVEPG